MKKNLKRNVSLLLAVILCLGLAGCGAEKKHYEAKDYILETEYRDDFKILQLCDIHMANKDNRQMHYDFMDLTIKDADPDMIIACGDLFTFADKTVAKELFAYFDSWGVPWTVTFGNHDEQCYFSIDWMTGYLNNYGSNCIFKDLQDDDVFGNSNFAINLVRDGLIKDQIIIMDSNRYNYGEYWGYDYFKQDQIDWYESIIEYTAVQNGGETVPSQIFCHIPVPEFQTAYDLAKAGSPEAVLEYGEFNEDVSCPKINSGFFDMMVELGSTNAMLVAHDHVNNARLLYKDIYLCYGVTSTDRIYYEDGMLGGLVLTVGPDGSLGFDYIYHDYKELEK